MKLLKYLGTSNIFSYAWKVENLPIYNDWDHFKIKQNKLLGLHFYKTIVENKKK